MLEPESAAHDAKRRRALPLPVIGLVAAVVLIIAAAAGLFVYLGYGERGEDPSLAAARELFDKGDYAGAEEALNEIVEEDAKDVAARRLLAQTLAAEGKNEAAVDEYLVVVEAEPDDHESLTAMARIEQLIGRANDAITHYEAAIKASSDPAYYAAVAPVYATVGRWDECVEAWQQYLELGALDEVHQAEVYASIASAYEDAREYDKAKEALGQAVFLDPNNASYKARLEAYEG